jgi:recombination protein RecA
VAYPAKEKKAPKVKLAPLAKDVKDIDDAISDIAKTIRSSGDENAMALGSDDNALRIKGVISTQCPTLDLAIGRGGIPLGRLTILHGAEAAGKSTSALHLVAQVQRLGGIAIYIDSEYKLDPDYAESIGVNTSRLIVSTPKTLETCFKVQSASIARLAQWRKNIGRRVPILVIHDSMNASITQAQLDGEIGDHHVAPQARCFSQNLPKLIAEASKEDVALCWISQIRKKIGIQFGDADELAGGGAPKFYASLIIKYKYIGTLKVGDEKIGNRVIAECRKNQIAMPFKKAEFNINYGKGIDGVNCLFEMGLEKGIFTRGSKDGKDGKDGKGGNTYKYGEKTLGKSNEEAKDALRKAPKTCARVAVKLGVPWLVENLEEPPVIAEESKPKTIKAAKLEAEAAE